MRQTRVQVQKTSDGWSKYQLKIQPCGQQEDSREAIKKREAARV